MQLSNAVAIPSVHFNKEKGKNYYFSKKTFSENATSLHSSIQDLALCGRIK